MRKAQVNCELHLYVTTSQVGVNYKVVKVHTIGYTDTQ